MEMLQDMNVILPCPDTYKSLHLNFIPGGQKNKGCGITDLEITLAMIRSL